MVPLRQNSAYGLLEFTYRLEEKQMKEIVSLTTKNVMAIGPYNLAVKANGFLFTSGMIGIDPETNELKPCVESQAEQIFINLKNILKDCNITIQNVVKTTVFLADMNDFAKVNTIYAKHFSTDFPARSCVEVSKLPKSALVEVELIATL